MSEPRPRPVLAAVALATLPVLVLADTGLLWARGWTPGGPLDRLAIGASTATAAGAFALLALPPTRRLLDRHWPKLLMLAAGLGLALLIAELGSRVLIRPTGFHLRPPNLSRVTRTDPELMPGIEDGAGYSTSSLGLRGPELPEERSMPRILFLGGSTTECLYLDDTETWPLLTGALLGVEAPVWAGSAGRSGRSSVHHLKYLEKSELLRNRQLDALVLLTGLNDMTKAYLGITEEAQRIGDLLPLWYRSHLAGILHGMVDRWLSDRSGRLEHWAVHLPRQQRERGEGEKRDPELDLEPWLDAYEARLERIVGVCREAGVKPIFLTQPVHWAEGLPPETEARFWFGWLEGGGFLTTRALRASVEVFNARTLETGARIGVPVVDLSPMHGDSRWFFDDCHFTEAGAREVAERLAGWMLEHPEAWKP